MAQTQLAAQMYSLRDFCKDPQSLAESLKKVKAMGYDAVQISGVCPIEYTDLKKLLDDAGLYCCATHIAYEKMRDETAKVIEEHHIIDCKYPAIGGLPLEYRNAEGFPRFAKEATEVGRKLAAEGCYFGYHNHSYEMEKYGDRTGLQAIYEDSDPKFLKAEIDTYWIQHGGGDPAQWITDLAGRIPLVHLKDMTIRAGQPIMAEVGEGNLNWPKIIDACKKSGVEWYIVEQDTCERDPFDSLKISLEHLKSWGLS
jgi:sugar phosphate isomerase/epimerase